MGERREAIAQVADAALDWITGDDTGISSRAIWCHMAGRKPNVRDRAFGDHPHDPDDFGRCHRLLLLMPEWRGRILEMAAYSSEWAALAVRWRDITASYEAELREQGQDPESRWVKGTAKRTYDLMRSIIEGAQKRRRSAPPVASPEGEGGTG